MWVVTRDKTERIESVKTRSNLTEEQIVARMNNQVNYDTLNLNGYTVIENSGDINALTKTVKEKAKRI